MLPKINSNERSVVSMGERTISSGLLHYVATKGVVNIRINNNFGIRLINKGYKVKLELVAYGNLFNFQDKAYFGKKKEVKKESLGNEFFANEKEELL